MDFIKTLLRSFRSTRGATGAGKASAEKADDEVAIYKELFRNMSQVLWVDNLEKTNSILNLGDYENIYGRPRDNLKADAQDWLNAVHEEDRKSVESKLADQIKGQYDVRYRVVHPDGSVKWLRDRSFVLRDHDSQPQYLAGVVEDITDDVLREDKLRQKNKMTAIGEISGGVAHDFNNILAVMQGNIELAMLDEMPSETRELLQRAFDASQKGAALTHRLLAYSRLQPLSPIILNASEVLSDLEVILDRVLKKSVELEVISSGSLWRCEADKNELETVLLNLVINADQAMESCGKLTIEAYNARLDADYSRQHEEVSPGQYVCFAISDNGCGMSDAVLARAFEPFYTTKPVGQGSGLGLSMAFGFTKQSGGHIKIYSEIDRGTTVKLYLPRAKEEVEPTGAETPVASRDSLAGLACLIIEDDQAVLDTIVQQAQSLGLKAFVAHGTGSASAVIREHPEIKLVLSDVVLAGEMTGPEVVSVLKAERPDLRAVFMSGYTENSIIHGGRLDEGIILLQKPFTSTQLLNAFLDLTV